MKWIDRIGRLTVLVALCMVAAIIIPNLLPARARGSLDPCRANAHNIATAIAMYRRESAVQDSFSVADLTPDYLLRVPVCPRDRSPYALRETGNGTVVYCSSNAHNDRDFTATVVSGETTSLTFRTSPQI